jgi:hypothetical protein
VLALWECLAGDIWGLLDGMVGSENIRGHGASTLYQRAAHSSWAVDV